MRIALLLAFLNAPIAGLGSVALGLTLALPPEFLPGANEDWAPPSTGCGNVECEIAAACATADPGFAAEMCAGTVRRSYEIRNRAGAVLEDRGDGELVVLTRLPALDVTAAAPTAAPPKLESLDNPLVFLRGFWRAVRGGDYFEAAALLAIFLIAGFRLGGKKLHDWLADDSILDKPLWFLLDTKPGRVLALSLTTSAAGVGGAWLMGERIDLALVKPILAVTFAASTLYGWAKDLWGWWVERYPGRAAQLFALFGVKVGPLDPIVLAGLKKDTEAKP
jgi:hypothetical protein